MVTESRGAWLRYLLAKWWLAPRAMTPLEMSQQKVIEGKDVEIAALTEQLAATQITKDEVIDHLHGRIGELEKELAREKEKLQARVEALESEVEVYAEMHTRIITKIKAETEAYNQRLPREARET